MLHYFEIDMNRLQALKAQMMVIMQEISELQQEPIPDTEAIEELKRIADKIREGLERCLRQEQLIIDGLQKSASH